MSSNTIPSVFTTFNDSSGEKLAHTKALLTSIYKENKPEEVQGSDSIDAALINRAIHLLTSEQEDELKTLLIQSFGSTNDVSSILSLLLVTTVSETICRAKCWTTKS
jgi:hypothetical protein